MSSIAEELAVTSELNLLFIGLLLATGPPHPDAPERANWVHYSSIYERVLSDSQRDTANQLSSGLIQGGEEVALEALRMHRCGRRSDDARAALHWVQVRNSMGDSGHQMPPHPAWTALGAELQRLSEAWPPPPTLPQPHTHPNAQQSSEAWQGQQVDGEAAQGALQPGLAAHMGQSHGDATQQGGAHGSAQAAGWAPTFYDGAGGTQAAAEAARGSDVAGAGVAAGFSPEPVLQVETPLQSPSETPRSKPRPRPKKAAIAPAKQAPGPVSSGDGSDIFRALLPAEAAPDSPGQPAAQHPGGVPEQANGFHVQPTAQDPGAVPEQANSFHVQPAAQHPSQGPGEDSLHMYGGQPTGMDYGSHPGVDSTPATPAPATPEPGAEPGGSRSNGRQLMQGDVEAAPELKEVAKKHGVSVIEWLLSNRTAALLGTAYKNISQHKDLSRRREHPRWQAILNLLVSLQRELPGSLLSLLRHLAWSLRVSGTKGPEAVKLVATICANLRVDSETHGMLLNKLKREADRCCTIAAAMTAQSLLEHRLPAPPAGTPPQQLAAAVRLSEAQQLWQGWGATALAGRLGQAFVRITGRPRVYLPSEELNCIQGLCVPQADVRGALTSLLQVVPKLFSPSSAPQQRGLQQVVQQLMELERLLPNGTLFRLLWLLRVQYHDTKSYCPHSLLRVIPHDALLFLAMLHPKGDCSPEARVRRLTSRTNNLNTQLKAYQDMLQNFCVRA